MDTIYAYWDAQQIKYVLDAVAMLTSMSDYTGLMKVFAIFGLFVAFATTFVKARGEDAAIYMLMLAIWYVGLFLPKKDVVVVDVAGGSGTYTVANVPLGLAVFASAESHIGYWLTKVSETVFALPGDISFEKTGFMFGSRAIKDRQSVRFYDPNLVSSLTNLTKDCVYPELNNNGPFFDQIMKSGDIWADIAPQMNPGLLVQVYDNAAGVYKIVGCDLAWSYIDAQINPHVSNDILPRLGRMLNPSSPTSAAASALVAAQLPAVDNFIFGVSQTAQESIKQVAMINLIADSTVFVPQMIGDTTSAQVALSTAMASASANSSYRTMAKIAESSMPLIRNAIHIVILALFPIVMLLIIVAGSKGGLVLRTYLMALLWINLWAPVYAALNFFTSWYATLGAKAAVDGMNPLSYASHQALMHSMISDQGVAGILTLSVPVIAYMLTNVSAASFTSVISGVMSPANSSAQTAGAQVGTGNISAGNTQWGNVTMGNWSANNRSADQWNTAPMNRHGAAIEQAVGADGTVMSSYGNGTSTAAQPMNALRVGASVTAGQSAGLLQQAGKHTSAGQAHTIAAGKAEETILSKARAHLSSLATTNQSGFGGRSSSGGDFTGSLGTSASSGEESGSDASYTTKNQASQKGSVRANAGGDIALGGNQTVTPATIKDPASGDGGVIQSRDSRSGKAAVTGSLKGGIDIAQEYAAGIQKQSRTGEKSAVLGNADARQAFFDRLEKDRDFRHSVLGQDADSQTTGATLSSRRTHLDQAQAEFRQAEDLTQQANQGSSRGVGVSYDPLKVPGNTNAALALVEAVEAAPPGQRDQAALNGLKTMGYDQGGQLPSAYQDGTAVRATPEEVQALAQAMMDDPALANQIRVLHAGHLRDVPNSGAPVGAGSAAANSNSDLPGNAQDYHDQGEVKHQKAMDYHEAKQESGELRYQGEAGDAAPQSPSVATHNKLMNTAEDAATDDMKLSLQQALPNEIAGLKVPGAKPTLEQFQEKVGYRPDGAKEETKE
ncbi:MAG: conjugal transfer protein TraG N-terminal domain-containing protein [Thiobacillaceae bacterium]